MDLYFLSTILLYASPLIFALSFIIPKVLRSPYASKTLPPGQTGLPFLGESINFLASGFKGHPETFIEERMAKFSPKVFKTSLFGERMAVFCGASGNKFLFSNENKLVTAWWPKSVDKIFPSGQQTSSQEEAKRMRKLLPNFFKPEALQRYIGMMDVIAQKHLASDWENKDTVTVFPLAKMFTFWLACRVFLSIEDPKHVAKFANPFNLVASGIISVPIDLPGTAFNKAIKAANEIRKELLNIIKQRKIDLAENKATPTQDILSHMLTTSDENGQFMKEMDIADKILGLLIGGHDTASGVVTFLVKYLADFPNIYQKVLEEQLEIAKTKKAGELLDWDDIQKMKYSWNVACEVMRIAPPLQGGFREVIAEFTFSGFDIPKGWKSYWSVNSTHKNPEYFKNPEKFDPSRFEGNGPAPYTYVPFGGGPRMCPGKEYARLEILVFMHNLVKRFKWERLIPNEKVSVNPLRVPANGLPVRLHPHKP